VPVVPAAPSAFVPATRTEPMTVVRSVSKRLTELPTSAVPVKVGWFR
jgi:hypothetical protein